MNLNDIFNINFLFILFILAILQWVIHIFYISKKQLWDNKQIEKQCNKKYKNKSVKFVGFSEDIFYQFWNLTPIILFFYWFYFYNNNSYWYKSINLISNLNYTNYNLDIMYFIFFLVFISIYAVYYQDIKQKNFIKNKTFCYWWDKRISKTIYYTRLFFLFFNMIFFIYSLVLLLMIIHFLINIILIPADLIVPILNHSDGNGGIGFISDISLFISILFFFLSGLGLSGLVSHSGKQGNMHYYLDLSLLLLIIPGLIIIIFPSIYLVDKLDLKYFELKEYIVNILYHQSSILNNNIIKGNFNEINNKILEGNYLFFLNFPKMPLSFNNFITIIITWLFPLMINLGKYIFKVRKTTLKKGKN